MSFKKLYNFAVELRQYPVILEEVLDAEAVRLSSQDELYYVPVDLDPDISLGHIKQYRVPGGVYGEIKWITEIRYFADLNMCWQRFVSCKELMHVFDSPEERVDSGKKFSQLLDEIEAPLPVDASSPMYRSESRTKWMALAVLCPVPIRDIFKPKWLAKELSDYEVALELRIPEGLIHTVMSDRYDAVLEYLLTQNACIP
jgi:hypothetical protein